MVNIQNSTYSAKVVCFLDTEDVTLWKHDAVHEEGMRLAVTILGELLKTSVPAAVFGNGYDCLNQGEIKVSMGSGQGQIEKMNRTLSRLNLHDKRKVRPLEVLIEEQKKELLSEQPVVLLITENHGEQLVELMAELARNGVPVLWIGTHYQEDFWNDFEADCVNFDFFLLG